MAKVSKRGRLIWKDIQKIIKGAGIAGGGAALAWVQSVYIPSLELNPLIASAIGAVLTNIAVKLFGHTEYVPPEDSPVVQ